MFYLFLDDVRDPHEAFFRKHKSFKIIDWIVVRTVEEAISVIKAKGLPEYISFDYDLEQGYTTDLISFLKDQPLSSTFDYDIHSTNKHGVNLIKEEMDKVLNRTSSWDY